MFWRKRRLERKAEKALGKMHRAVFPGGQRQIEAETAELFARLGQHVPLDEARQILIHAKGRVFIAFQSALGSTSPIEDPARRCVESIRLNAGGALDETMARDVYAFAVQSIASGMPQKKRIVGDAVRLRATQARKADHVVDVCVDTPYAGIAFEYRWLERQFGEKDRDWTIEERKHGWADDGKAYEIFTLSTKHGHRRVVSFDISSFYQG